MRQNVRNPELSATIYLPLSLSLPIRTFINPNADAKSMGYAAMGYAATSQPQAHVEDFARISLGPSRPVAGARRRWFEVTPIGLHAPGAENFRNSGAAKPP